MSNQIRWIDEKAGVDELVSPDTCVERLRARGAIVEDAPVFTDFLTACKGVSVDVSIESIGINIPL